MDVNGKEVTELKDNKEPLYVGVLKCYCDLRKKNEKNFTISTQVSGFRILTNKEES
jgi:hypothetical protein